VSDAFDWFTRRGKQIRRAAAICRVELAFLSAGSRRPHQRALLRNRADRLDGYSKPREMYGVRYTKPPNLPHQSEYSEVIRRRKTESPSKRACARATWRPRDLRRRRHPARPAFQDRENRPVRLFTEDMEAMVRFYRDDLA